MDQHAIPDRSYKTIAAGEDMVPVLWEVRVYGATFRCSMRLVSEEAQSGIWSGTASIDKIDETIFVRDGESESFSDIELARRWFATDWDGFSQSAADSFFATIDPARYDLDISQSDAIRLVLDPANPHPWIVDGTATNAVATIAYADAGILLWYLVFGSAGYYLRSWQLTEDEHRMLLDWEHDYRSRIQGEPLPPPPAFTRPADSECTTGKAERALEFLAQADEKLDFAAKDMFHLLWPETYRQVTANERPWLLVATRLR